MSPICPSASTSAWLTQWDSPWLPMHTAKITVMMWNGTVEVCPCVYVVNHLLSPVEEILVLSWSSCFVHQEGLYYPHWALLRIIEDSHNKDLVVHSMNFTKKGWPKENHVILHVWPLSSWHCMGNCKHLWGNMQHRHYNWSSNISGKKVFLNLEFGSLYRFSWNETCVTCMILKTKTSAELLGM